MSRSRSSCFWSGVISLTVRLTVLAKELMTVKSGELWFWMHTPRFYRKRWRREHRHYEVYDDRLGDGIRNWKNGTLRFIQGRVSGIGDGVGGTYTRARSHRSQRIEICGGQAKSRVQCMRSQPPKPGTRSLRKFRGLKFKSIIILLYVPEEKNKEKL